MKLETSFRDPADLHPHPKVKHLLGRWAKDSEEALAMRRSILEQGILQPLIITERGEVLDGVTRWQAAKALQLTQVPVTIRPEAEALDILLATELHRRHHSKGQLAFRMAPMVAEAFKDAKARRLANIQKSPAILEANPVRIGAKTVKDYAAEMGMSDRLLGQAHELHTYFAEHPEKRSWTSEDAVANLALLGYRRDEQLSFQEYYQPLLLLSEKPMSLKGALNGIKYTLSVEDLQRKGLRGRHKGRADLTPSKQLDLWTDVFDTLTTRYDYWQKFDERERSEAEQALAKSLEQAPDDFVETLKRKLAEELRRRKSQVE